MKQLRQCTGGYCTFAALQCTRGVYKCLKCYYGPLRIDISNASDHNLILCLVLSIVSPVSTCDDLATPSKHHLC